MKFMGKHQAQNKPFQPSDYNEPTEPLVLPQYSNPAYGVDNAFPMAPTVPASPLHLPPVAPVMPSLYPYPQPSQAAYPVLPPAPLKKYRGYPPGGTAVEYKPLPARRRRSSLPGLVRFGFFLVQLVLLARVVCLLFGVQNTALWLTLLFAAGDLFVLPVRWLAANITLSVLAGTPILIYLEFLVAILVYGIFSRLLTLLLRALLN